MFKDYEIEKWLYSLSERHENSPCGCPNWFQLTQYTAFHTINEWYSLPSKSRTAVGLEQIINKFWFHKVKRFRSAAHYDFVEKSLKHHLRRILLSSESLVIPHLLFESIQIHMKSLSIDTSMIFHILEPGEKTFVIKKFVVDHCLQVIEAFFHMSVVFCQEAFGELPDRIEVHDLLYGTTQIFIPKKKKLSQSIDYMQMMKGLYLESRCTCRKERVHELV